MLEGSLGDAQPAARLAVDEGRGGRPLRESPLEASWDPDLAPAMAERGVVVEEEAVLDVVLGDLAGG